VLSIFKSNFEEGRHIVKNQLSNRIMTDDEVTDKTKVGYVRVSTEEQNEARQLEAFKDLNLYKTFIEKISAKDTNRPLLKQMLEYVREGDTVYIKDFSRLARSTKDLLDITEDLNNRGIKLVSLKENLDTSTPTGKLMLTLIGAIYQFERENTLERQREGIALAKREGKFKGRREIERPDKWDEVYSQYIIREITATEAMTRLNLKRNTFYKMLDGAEKCYYVRNDDAFKCR
jgi:DNA invertase Pin-like site-specific DNA recombinase